MKGHGALAGHTQKAIELQKIRECLLTDEVPALTLGLLQGLKKVEGFIPNDAHFLMKLDNGRVVSSQSEAKDRREFVDVLRNMDGVFGFLRLLA